MFTHRLPIASLPSLTPAVAAASGGALPSVPAPGRAAHLDVDHFVARLAAADADETLETLAFWRAQGTMRRLRRAGHTGAELQHMTRALVAACRRHGLLD